jgi:hypothetical protein
MLRNLINKKVAFGISDPWDLGEQLGWTTLEATVIKVKDEGGVSVSLAIKLTDPFVYKDTRCEFFIVSPRLEGNDFSQLDTKQPVFSGFTRVSSDQIISDDTFDLSHWRGGVALIGSIKLSA